MKIYEGSLVSEGIKVGVVCARFNDFLVSKLLSGCEDGLLRRGVQGRTSTWPGCRGPLRFRW